MDKDFFLPRRGFGDSAVVSSAFHTEQRHGIRHRARKQTVSHVFPHCACLSARMVYPASDSQGVRTMRIYGMPGSDYSRRIRQHHRLRMLWRDFYESLSSYGGPVGAVGRGLRRCVPRTCGRHALFSSLHFHMAVVDAMVWRT